MTPSPGARLVDWALEASVVYYRGRTSDERVFFGADTVSAAEMAASLEALRVLVDGNPSPEALAAEIRRRFMVYRAAHPAVLFTGYYVPTVTARASPDRRFRFPVLGRPPDLVTASLPQFGAGCSSADRIVGRVAAGQLVPYFTRAEIEAGAVRGAPVLAWVDDPVALFLLQIQGSGTLLFPDGTRRPIGFAASNGLPYVSIAKLLVDDGRLPANAATTPDVRRWISDHPGERERLLAANPRYVFFQPIIEPTGSLGVPLTPGRTIATDAGVYPPGALAFVRVGTDSGNDGPTPTVAADGTIRPFARLVLNQDTGAAISGPGRVDVFFGSGPEAEDVAGRLRARGELLFLAPRHNAG